MQHLIAGTLRGHAGLVSARSAQVVLLDVRGPVTPVRRFAGHVNSLTPVQLAVSADDALVFLGTWRACGGTDRWGAADPSLPPPPSKKNEAVGAGSVAAGGEDKAIRCWSVGTGRLVASWQLDGPILGQVARAAACGRAAARPGAREALWYVRGAHLYSLPFM